MKLNYTSTRIGVFSSILKILLCEPLALLIVLQEINPFDLKYDRACSIITACDRHLSSPS